MTAAMLKIMDLACASSEPLTPSRLGKVLNIPRPSLTRALRRLVAEGRLKRVGRGTYLTPAAAASYARDNATAPHAAHGAFMGKTVLVAARWAGILTSPFSQAVLHGVNAEGGAVHSFSLESWAHPRDYLTTPDFHACDAMILYHYHEIDAAMRDALKKTDKPVVIASYHGNLDVDTVGWNAVRLFETFASKLLDAGCSVLALVEPCGPDDPFAGVSLKSQVWAVAGAATMAGAAFHFLQLDGNSMALNFNKSALMRLVRCANSGHKLGVICWRSGALYTLVALLSALDIRLNEDVLLCGMDNGQSPEFHDVLFARARAPEREVGLLAVETLRQRFDRPGMPPSLTLTHGPILA